MLATIDDLNQILRQRVCDALVHEKVNIREPVEKELQSLEAVIVDKKAEYIWSFPFRNKHKLSTNKVYLESIIHNLLSHSIKYTFPESGALVRVKN